MAREEHDREDLLREATAFADRAEFDVPGFSAPVFFGIRRDGAASFYFGAEQVYHFNERCALRRAFLKGLLYKTDRGALVSLERRRDQNETSLLSRRLSADETTAFLAEMQRALARLAESFAAGLATQRGKVTSPETAALGQSVYDRIASWLAKMPTEFALAHSPRVS